MKSGERFLRALRQARERFRRRPDGAFTRRLLGRILDETFESWAGGRRLSVHIKAVERGGNPFFESFGVRFRLAEASPEWSPDEVEIDDRPVGVVEHISSVGLFGDRIELPADYFFQFTGAWSEAENLSRFRKFVNRRLLQSSGRPHDRPYSVASVAGARVGDDIDRERLVERLQEFAAIRNVLVDQVFSLRLRPLREDGTKAYVSFPSHERAIELAAVARVSESVPFFGAEYLPGGLNAYQPLGMEAFWIPHETGLEIIGLATEIVDVIERLHGGIRWLVNQLMGKPFRDIYQLYEVKTIRLELRSMRDGVFHQAILVDRVETITEDEHQVLAAIKQALPRLEQPHSVPGPIRSGADLVAYWQAEGLVGSRPDIEDSQVMARELRERAQRRGS